MWKPRKAEFIEAESRNVITRNSSERWRTEEMSAKAILFQLDRKNMFKSYIAQHMTAVNNTDGE